VAANLLDGEAGTIREKDCELGHGGQGWQRPRQLLPFLQLKWPSSDFSG